MSDEERPQAPPEGACGRWGRCDCTTECSRTGNLFVWDDEEDESKA